MEELLWIPLGLGFLGLGAVGVLYWLVKKEDPGPEELREIASYIEQGAKAFLRREFTTMAYFVIIIATALAACFCPTMADGWVIPVGFVLGAAFSMLAIFIGMSAAVKANVRTANLARSSAGKALVLAFRGGGVMGLNVVSMELVGLGLLCLIARIIPGTDITRVSLLAGFGFGASLAALFAQLGGGIYTKAADVGADLVGKVEVGIPEDDPRNPAVIADLVGDNVGDCAGRGADLYESGADNLVCMMIIGAIASLAMGFPLETAWKLIALPLLARGLAVVATLVGLLAIRPWEKATRSLNLSFLVTCVVLLVGFYFLAQFVGYMELMWCFILGLAAALVVVLATQYYTGAGHKPVVETARAARMGAAINIMMGLSYGMESLVLPVVFVGIALITSYFIMAPYGPVMGFYGTAAAVIGITNVKGIIQASDTFGPIVDNADGIAEMSGIKEEVGEALDRLDAVGNVTKAITKGFATACSIMASLIMLFTYVCSVAELKGIRLTDLSAVAQHLVIADPRLVIGALLGTVVPFVFAALAIRAVGRGAYGMVEEVRRQFREIPGIMEGKAKPDYARCVDIATKRALKDMVAPTLVGLLAPVLVGFILGPWALTAFLLTCTLVGTCLGISMFNAGATLDNAKKYIEEGHFGGKGTDAHKASVIGDTLGDPLKDTAGPSLNILIKLVNIVAITLAALFVTFAIV